MACNTLSLASSAAAGITAYSRPLSSASAPFVASSAPSMPPLSSSSPLKSLSVSCSLSEKDAPANSMGKALLTGLIAAGAALSVFTADTVSSPAALAASGPGTSGADRTAQKAQNLLKAADKLNIEDAPKRFGPGQIMGSPQDAGKVAQDAGGKAFSKVQDGISSIGGTVSGKKGEAQSAAESVASQAQSKVDEATGNSGPGGLFSSIKDSFQGIKESVAQKDGDAKKTLENAASSVQSTIQ